MQMHGSVPFFVYHAKNAERFLAGVLELVGLMPFDSDEIIWEHVLPFVVESDAALSAKNDYAVLVLMALEGGVAAGGHFVVADLERGEHFRAEDLFGDGHPSAGVVLVRLNFDAFPCPVAVPRDHF